VPSGARHGDGGSGVLVPCHARLAHCPRSPQTAKVGRDGSNKLVVMCEKRSFLAGHPHWTAAAERGLEYMPEDYEAKRKASRAAWEAEQARLKGRAAFSPVGPAVTRFAAVGGEDAMLTASPPSKGSAPSPVRPATAGSASGHSGSGAGGGGGGAGPVSRPPFNQYSHYDPDKYIGLPRDEAVEAAWVASLKAMADADRRPTSSGGRSRGSTPLDA